MDKFLRRKDLSSRTDDEEPSTSVTKNLKKVVKRKTDVLFDLILGKKKVRKPKTPLAIQSKLDCFLSGKVSFGPYPNTKSSTLNHSSSLERNNVTQKFLKLESILDIKAMSIEEKLWIDIKIPGSVSDDFEMPYSKRCNIPQDLVR
ncbi:hypothetical protein NPIL_447691 [Nephila pilipes]|uniref:Uncharacterized protein n=1 Tax=Nephila pilipes TaxID=299642 RepID=A0A8X6TBE9_NEPPI|nr:hypothetical protein NPIL_447691 [Nephila pilipes]